MVSRVSGVRSPQPAEARICRQRRRRIGRLAAPRLDLLPRTADWLHQHMCVHTRVHSIYETAADRAQIEQQIYDIHYYELCANVTVSQKRTKRWRTMGNCG